MADNQLQAPMPAVTLDAGCTITIETLDPSTGLAVTGVTVAKFALRAVNVAPDIGQSVGSGAGASDVLPLWLRLPADLPPEGGAG